MESHRLVFASVLLGALLWGVALVTLITWPSERTITAGTEPSVASLRGEIRHLQAELETTKRALDAAAEQTKDRQLNAAGSPPVVGGSEPPAAALESEDPGVATFEESALRARESASHTHRVAAGEALESIAFAYGTTVETLAAINGIADPQQLRAGTMLRLP